MDNQTKLKLHFQRFEFKYQIPIDLVEGMIPEFLKYMEWDSYAKDLTGNSYVVSSLYYDTAGAGCYYQNLNGERMRKKLRIRFYDPALKAQTPVFLEIKRKYDMVSVKDRLILPYQNCGQLLRENEKLNLTFSGHDRDTLNEFLWLKFNNGLLAQNMVIYDRKPLISKLDPNFRVTIDYNLRTYLADWLDDKKDGILVNPDQAILEVKFNNSLPFWFYRLIRKFNLDRRPFSKYCRSLEACRPGLNNNFAEIYQSQLGILNHI